MRHVFHVVAIGCVAVVIKLRISIVVGRKFRKGIVLESHPGGGIVKGVLILLL